MLRLALATVTLAFLTAVVATPVEAKVTPPELPCQTGIAGSDCAVGALDCVAHAGYRTGSQSYEYAYVYCGPTLWAPCTVAYVDTDGNVYSCLIA